MKITFGGRYTIAEFSNLVENALMTLYGNGVEEVQYASLYLHTYADRRQYFLLDENGHRIEHLDHHGAQTQTYKDILEQLSVVQNGSVERQSPGRRRSK